MDRQHGRDRQHLLGFGAAGAGGPFGAEPGEAARPGIAGWFWRRADLGCSPVRVGRRCGSPPRCLGGGSRRIAMASLPRGAALEPKRAFTQTDIAYFLMPKFVISILLAAGFASAANDDR